MCGACGVKGAGHWSVPLLACVPARSAAAKAVTAMAGGRAGVTATAGGYLVSFPTGRREAVADLGAVWDVLSLNGFPDRSTAILTDLRGPATRPAPRAALTSVALIEGRGSADVPAGVDLDARDLSPTDVLARLRSLVDGRRSPELRVLIRESETTTLLPHLRAHPARPFAVTEVLEQGSEPRTDLRLPEQDYLPRLPSLLSWLAALDGSPWSRCMHLRLPLPGGWSLAIDLLHGVLTRCEAQPAAGTPPKAGSRVEGGDDRAVTIRYSGSPLDCGSTVR